MQGDLAQLVRVAAFGVEGEREDRDVVDGVRLHQRRGDAGRQRIAAGGELRFHLDDALLLVFPDLEAHGDHGLTVPGYGIDMLYAGDFPERPFQAAHDQVLGFLGGHAGRGGEDVDHGDGDLWLFLARSGHHAEDARRQRGDGDQWREL